MDFDKATLNKILASTEEHTQRLAEISATATKQAQAMRYAVSSGDYERAWELIQKDNAAVHDDDPQPDDGIDPNAAQDGTTGNPSEPTT